MTDVLDRPDAKGDLKVVGTRTIRPDGADKVTGRRHSPRISAAASSTARITLS